MRGAIRGRGRVRGNSVSRRNMEQCYTTRRCHTKTLTLNSQMLVIGGVAVCRVDRGYFAGTFVGIRHNLATRVRSWVIAGTRTSGGEWRTASRRECPCGNAANLKVASTDAKLLSPILGFIMNWGIKCARLWQHCRRGGYVAIMDWLVSFCSDVGVRYPKAQILHLETNFSLMRSGIRGLNQSFKRKIIKIFLGWESMCYLSWSLLNQKNCFYWWNSKFLWIQKYSFSLKKTCKK